MNCGEEIQQGIFGKLSKNFLKHKINLARSEYVNRNRVKNKEGYESDFLHFV